MIRTISFDLEKIPNTCFDCMFSNKIYCDATCPFLHQTTTDGEPILKDCPLKKKNAHQIYSFHTDVYK